jgi:hypothetical protein
MHSADLARAYTVLSRSCENGGKLSGSDRYDTAGAAFVEEAVFGGTTGIHIRARAKLRRSMRRPYKGSSSGEAGFG